MGNIKDINGKLEWFDELVILNTSLRITKHGYYLYRSTSVVFPDMIAHELCTIIRWRVLEKLNYD